MVPTGVPISRITSREAIMSKQRADLLCPDGKALPPVLPVAPEGAALVREVAERILAPRQASRDSGRVPPPVEAVLRMLEDPALQRRGPGQGPSPDRSSWRRAVIRGLQGRHPEALASFRRFARSLASRGAESRSAPVIILLLTLVIGGIQAWDGCRDLEPEA
jgi:hypothetical protein